MFISSILGKFYHDLAIDLGTSNTIIYAKGKGIVLNEPSVAAIKREATGKLKVLTIGKEAKKMMGRTPENIEVIRPMKDGVIADFEITLEMLRYFISKVYRRWGSVRTQIIIAVPIGITPVEKKAVRECVESIGSNKVFLIEEPMAAAIGSGLPVTEPTCNMVADIGGGTTEVAVISLASIVYSKSVRVAGDKIDEAIVQHLNRDHNFLIGLSTAELIKTTIGSAFPNVKTETMKVKGRDLVTGIPNTLTIDSDEVRKMISEELNTIVQTVISALEQMPPELSADILERGIVLTGGGSLLKNLDMLLRDVTKLPIIIKEDALFSVALGAGKALDDFSILKAVRID
jgi:rod shape-determining protein MreB